MEMMTNTQDEPNYHFVVYLLHCPDFEGWLISLWQFRLADCGKHRASPGLSGKGDPIGLLRQFVGPHSLFLQQREAQIFVLYIVINVAAKGRWIICMRLFYAPRGGRRLARGLCGQPLSG